MIDVRILIIDSDAAIRSTIRECTAVEGFLSDEASDGIAAIKLFRRNEYQLVVVDSMTPELDGRLVCKLIRKVSDIPIIVISTIGVLDEKLSFFECGADDFVMKPFEPLELNARIKVFLRRTSSLVNTPSRSVFCNGIHIDTLSRTVNINEKLIQLTPKEYDLLLFLSRNPNKAFSRQTLLNEVWGHDFYGTDRTVDTHIKTLRENIKPCHQCIITIWGYGYKFEG